jgi:ATP-dependent Clp protease ATP-binding subunit ClpA
VLEHFTAAARAAVLSGQDVARAMGARQVGTEHLLVALLPPDSPAAVALGVTGPLVADTLDVLEDEALAALGIGMAELRDRLLVAHPRGRLPMTAGGKAALVGALREARALKERRLTERHLLLALLRRERPDPAAEVLARLGVDVEEARRRLTDKAAAA